MEKPIPKIAHFVLLNKLNEEVFDEVFNQYKLGEQIEVTMTRGATHFWINLNGVRFCIWRA